MGGLFAGRTYAHACTYPRTHAAHIYIYTNLSDLLAMSSLEAKIVVLGAQGVGKTSLLMRYCKGAFNPAQVTSTVGASFLTKRVVDSDTDTVVRLQIWDTGRFLELRNLGLLICPLILERKTNITLFLSL